jgi:hypothetical protein
MVRPAAEQADRAAVREGAPRLHEFTRRVAPECSQDTGAGADIEEPMPERCGGIGPVERYRSVRQDATQRLAVGGEEVARLRCARERGSERAAVVGAQAPGQGLVQAGRQDLRVEGHEGRARVSESGARLH